MAGNKKSDQEPVEGPQSEDTVESQTVENSGKEQGASLDAADNPDELTSEAEAEAAWRAKEPAQEKVIERTVEKRGGFLPALIGGVVAAGIGFAVGSGVFSSGGTETSDAIAALESKLSDQSDQIAQLTKSLSDEPDVSGLSDQIKALSDKLAPVESDLSAVKSSVDTLSGQVGPLGDRLSALEKAPVEASVSPETAAAFEAELKKLQDSLTAQRGEVEKMVSDAQALEAKAAAEARAATNTAILSRLQGKLDAGQPYEDLVSQLQAGGLTVPEALTASADKGVATIAALSSSFSPAARTALADARDANKGTGLVAFLQRQTGARSVTPQDGDDPDAVLSRAQAALSDGDVSGALTELKSLPEAAQTAMADWETAAQARLAAVDAVNALAASVNSN
ncbi:hypothetical protein RA28_21580 [Ruegeria sp. ANG-S4]|uniref:hypothetical protein n=1 Tax=Ruegeria sp. ANG-S4 TaxID=1577904 RepID=UPI00057E205A|nr:hypothetical protein [Ruegeria sp. ANG-S4]KIC41035.1 hypothetical protein RA28_21580 [Ruegeria sp. ANG-S4]